MKIASLAAKKHLSLPATSTVMMGFFRRSVSSLHTGAVVRKKIPTVMLMLPKSANSPKRMICSATSLWNASLLPTSKTTTRTNAVHPTLSATILGGSYRRNSSSAAASAAYGQSVDVFPSIVIGPDKSIVPQGSFAEAQAQYLDPDPDAVTELSENLRKANMGVVAHYYMDVELQGVLHAVGRELQRVTNSNQTRIAVADSLAMGDHAVRMCQDGVTAIACLGVDFMAESVAAIMERNGYGHVPVYRATPKPIGCSLAESAERDAYRAWLEKAREEPNALHIVYINTSLETKAVSTSIIPTITCTSSNVLQTMLQASAEVPDLKIFYGPDTYMGENLVSLFAAILNSRNSDSADPWDDERIARDLHPKHNHASIQRLRDNIDVYPHGNCVVHHMFGGEVVNAVKKNYSDAYVTAHLEVPGEMFSIALEKSLVGQGVVGSTSDILRFISRKVAEATEKLPVGGMNGKKERLKFILGTEAGMVTSIVKSVQEILESKGTKNLEAEIIFPVASDAIMGVEGGPADLAVVPGVSGGEGCSTAGGCATCPFMKMNDLDALNDIVNMALAAEAEEKRLKLHLPPDRLKGKMLGNVNATDLGTEPILYMRHFMKEKSMHENLIQKITTRA